MKVPFLRPPITDADIKLAVRSIKSGWLGYGPYAKELESRFAAYFDVPHVVLTSTGTAALHLAVVLAKVAPGDEVITTPISWVSSSDAIIYEGGKPVFVDVDPITGLIDVAMIERAITPKTKAILVVHMYGQMCDMRAISAIAKKHKLMVIEDAAHAIESSRDGVRPGELGDIACLSFQAAKNITSGQGGALIMRDQGLAELARLWRRNGVIGRDQNRRKRVLGYKYDGTDFQAALLVGQLKRIAKTHARRERVYAAYDKAFKGHPKIRTLARVPKSVHACHMYPIFVDPQKREEIRAKLSAQGVETSIHFEAIHLEPYYREAFGSRDGMFPNAEAIGMSEITLPTYADLSAKEQRFVIGSILASI